MKNLLIITALAFFSICTSQSLEEKIEVTIAGKAKMRKDSLNLYHSMIPLYHKDGVTTLFSRYIYVDPPIEYSVKKDHYFSKLIQMDSSLNIIKRQHINLSQENTKKEFDACIYLNNNINIFSLFKNKKTKKVYLFVETYDKEKLTPNNDLKKIAEIDYADVNKYKRSKFQYSQSPDSSKIVISCILYDKEGEIISDNFSVLDNNFNELWSKKNTEIGLTANGIAVYGQLEISDAGDVYRTAELYKNKKAIENTYAYYSRKANYQTLLYCYWDQGSREKVYRLGFNDYFLRSIEYTTTEDKVVGIGLYSRKGQTSAIGTYYFEIDKWTQEICNTHKDKFDLDYILQGHATKFNMNDPRQGYYNTIKKNYNNNLEFEYGTCNLDIRVKDKNNGYWLIYTQSENDDIKIISMDNKGNTLWKDKIERMIDTSTGRKHGHYQAHLDGKDIYILYNDFGKLPAITRRIANPETACLKITKYNDSGICQTAETIKLEEINMLPFVTEAEMFDDNSFFVFSWVGLNHNKFRIKFKQ